MGFYGSKGPFFAMPPMFLSGTALAGGIAWINSIGNLGGFFGPWYVGVMKDVTGSYAGGLYGLAITQIITIVVVTIYQRYRQNPGVSLSAPPGERWRTRCRGDPRAVTGSDATSSSRLTDGAGAQAACDPGPPAVLRPKRRRLASGGS